MVISLSTKPFSIDPMALVMHERKVVGSLCYTAQNFEDVISFLHDGKLHIPGFITRKIARDDLVDEGFEVLCRSEKKKQITILVAPVKELLEKNNIQKSQNQHICSHGCADFYSYISRLKCRVLRPSSSLALSARSMQYFTSISLVSSAWRVLYSA